MRNVSNAFKSLTVRVYQGPVRCVKVFTVTMKPPSVMLYHGTIQIGLLAPFNIHKQSSHSFQPVNCLSLALGCCFCHLVITRSISRYGHHRTAMQTAWQTQQIHLAIETVHFTLNKIWKHPIAFYCMAYNKLTQILLSVL